MLTAGDIDRIGRHIVSRCDPWVLGIFGSYATGLAHDGSDLDLFAIMPTVQPPAMRGVPFRRAMRGVMHPIDIVVFTPREFEQASAEYMSFAWVIARQARILHAKPAVASCQINAAGLRRSVIGNR